MIWRGEEYKPIIAWRTVIREAVMVSAETEYVPAIYQITVTPVDLTNPGASTSDKLVGDYVMDYLGHIYRIIEINVGGNSNRVKVSDDFRWQLSPINGKQGIVYRSVGEGTAPWLAVTYGTHLSSTAANTAAGIDNAILWKISERVQFTNTDTPMLINYQSNYRIPYGDNPKIMLYQIDESGNIIERTEKPYFQLVDGLIDSITFGVLDEEISGYILISR